MPQMYHSTRKLKISDLGGENILPIFSGLLPSAEVKYTKEVPQSALKNSISETRAMVLPYLIQNKYNRKQQEGVLSTFVLENSKLKATFYPQYGGRLASLFDKEKQKELLFDNPVFQPANLALRNAWFSGGVEWNGPIYGHTPQTCAPVYFAKIKVENEEILRIYEYDRILNTTWQVDVYLPDNSSHLWYHVTSRNLNPHSVNYYWWTNIATPISKKIRFMVASKYVLSHFFEDVFPVEWPIDKGLDISYPINNEIALSYFYQDPEEKTPWFSYADENGYGLFHMGSKDLMGKKLWYFGSGSGGTNWMDTLSELGKGGYIEIQAGLTETQLQTVPISAYSTKSFTGCMGPISCDPKQTHQKDYDKAVQNARNMLKSEGLFDAIEVIHQKMHQWEDTEPEVILHEGEAWGCLQEKLSGKKIPGLLFTAPITEKEQPWYELITEKSFSKNTLIKSPSSWNISYTWQKILEESLASTKETWLHHLHLGACFLEKMDFANAKIHFEKSIHLRPHFQNYRGLAIVEGFQNNTTQQLKMYAKAWEISDENEDLFLEYVKFLLDAKQVSTLMEIITQCPTIIKNHEFISIANALIAVENKQFELARKLLVREYLFIREGNFITTTIWFDSLYKEAEQKLNRSLSIEEKKEIQSKNPPPASIDFRMKEV